MTNGEGGGSKFSENLVTSLMDNQKCILVCIVGIITQDITSLFTQALSWPYFKRAAMEAKQRRHEDKRIDGIHNIVQCTLT